MSGPAPAGHRRRTTASYDGSMPLPFRRMLWAFLPFLFVSVVHVTGIALHLPLVTPTKALLMPALAIPLAVFWRAIAPRAAAVLLAAALLFSWLGDEAGLFFPTLPELPLMLGFFGLAHVAYIILFLRHLRERRLPLWTIVYVLWWMLMLTVLAPRTGSLFAAVAVYGALLALTAILSAGCSPMIAWGGALFLASDTLLAFRLFVEGMPGWTSTLVMLTYTAGQGLLVAGSLRAVRRRQEVDDAAEVSA